MNFSKEAKKRLFKAYGKINSLSNNAKLDGVKSFDLPLSTCENRCLLSGQFFKICYAHNNQQTHINPDRIAKLKHNLRMIRSPKFVKTLSYEIRECLHFRFFGMGDIENLEQLRKIFQVCKIRHETKFSMITSRDDLLCQAVQNRETKPDNLQIILSSGLIDEPVPAFEQKILNPLGVQFSHITTNPDKATCQASKTGFCDNCRDCYKNPADQTSTNQDSLIIFSLHGKYNTARAEKMKDYQNGTGSAVQTVQNHAKTQNQTKTKTRRNARTD